MNRAGLLVVVAALVLAIVTSWSPAQAQEHEQRNASAIIAQIVDASVESAPVLSKYAQDDTILKAIVDGRDVQVIDVNALLDAEQAELLGELLNGSDVLRQNVLLTRAVAVYDGPIARTLQEQNIPIDDVVAVDLTDNTVEPLSVYVFRH